MFHAVFPDLSYEVGETIAEGDKVCFSGQIRGTHESEFLGIEPTGNQINIMSLNVVRIENGKIAERWANVDILRILQQLGVDPLQTAENHQ